MASDRLSLVLAAGQRHLAATTGAPATTSDDRHSASRTKRMDKEASDLLKDPIDNVFFLREPWDDAPADMHPERWVFHVRGHYDLYVRFPRDYPFHAPDIDVQILGAHMPIKRYLTLATRQGDLGEPKPGYEEAFAIVNNHTRWPKCFDPNRWSPALTVRMLVTDLIDNPALQAVLAQAGTFYT